MKKLITGTLLLSFALASPLIAQELTAQPAAQFNVHLSDLRAGIDTVWTLCAALLVFLMSIGFSLLGSSRVRSNGSVLTKIFVAFAIAAVSFWLIGWGLMWSDGGAWMGTGGLEGSKGLVFTQGTDNSPVLGKGFESMNPFSKTEYKGVYSAIAWAPVPLWAKLFFQMVIAGVATVIALYAVADRVKLTSLILFGFLFSALIYPVLGHWIWGDGVLTNMGFRDFAGSTVIHSVAGWATLAGMLLLGPRMSKSEATRNMTSVSLGVFILWLGWFGLNAGSTMTAMNGKSIAHILVNTNIAAAMGSLGALLASWLLLKKPSILAIFNGCLAGLVAISAPCAMISLHNGAIIGFIGGILVTLGMLMFQQFKIEDRMGALSVHLINGIWGTLAVGLFYDDKVATGISGLATGNLAKDQFLVQVKGVLLIGAFAFVSALIAWYIIKFFFDLQSGTEEENQYFEDGENPSNTEGSFLACDERKN